MEPCQNSYARVGSLVEDFSFAAYNPVRGEFEDKSFKHYFEKKKWLVLVFYPADFTFVCPTELASIAKKHEEMKKLGAEVISFSTDSKYVHIAWRNSERLLESVNYLMGSDPTGKICRYFGVYDEEAGAAMRGTFIINPAGILVGAEITYHNVGRNASELLRKLQASVYVSEHSEQACPADWEEGDKTLTPSIKSVGKVYEELGGK